MITLAEVHVVDGHAGLRADLGERRAAVHAGRRSEPLLLVRLLLAGPRGRPVVLVQGGDLAQLLLLPRHLVPQLMMLLLLAVLRGSAHSESVNSRLNIIACR